MFPPIAPGLEPGTLAQFLSKTLQLSRSEANHLALVLAVDENVAGGVDTLGAVSGVWASRSHAEDRAVEVAEEWGDGTVEETVDEVDVGSDTWGEETRGLVEDGGGKEAGGLAGSGVGDVHAEGNEVVQALVLARNGDLGGGGEEVDDVKTGASKGVWGRAAEPVVREGLVEVERSDVLVVSQGLVGAVGKSTEDEDTLSSGDGQPSDTGVELRVVLLGLVVAKDTLVSPELVAELAVVLLGHVDDVVPADKVEVGLVAEVSILTGDGVVDLEETVTADSERGTKGVWDTRVGTSDGVLSGDQVTTGEQTEGGQESASVVTEAKSDLASVGGLSEGGDTVAGDVTVVGHGVQGWAHATDGAGSGSNVWVVDIRDDLKAELLGTESMLAFGC